MDIPEETKEQTAYYEGYYEGKQIGQKEIERLRKALKRYGRHKALCDIYPPYIERKCTCGLEQALKEE